MLEYACDRRIISDDDNVGGKDNFPSFQEHRWDQSILTNLAIKHGLSVHHKIDLILNVIILLV